MRILNNLKNSLSKYKDIEFAMAFGSILDDKKFNKNSDIDIAIAGKKTFPINYILNLNVDLTSCFSYEFDIIDLSKNSGVILQQALCNGKILVNRNHEIYAQLIKKMWYNQADMMQNVRMIWEKRRNKIK